MVSIRSIELHFDASSLLVTGRRGDNKNKKKSFIPSVDEWCGRTTWLHIVASEGCPFAQSIVIKTENDINRLRAEVQKEISRIDSLLESSLVNFNPWFKVKKVIDLESYLPIAVSLIEVLAYIDRLRAKCITAARGGLINFTLGMRGVMRFERKFRRIKLQPYIYRDNMIRGFEAKGTMEWVSAVKQLGFEPEQVEYKPQYFMNPKLVRKTTPPVETIDTDVSQEVPGDTKSTPPTQRNKDESLIGLFPQLFDTHGPT